MRQHPRTVKTPDAPIREWLEQLNVGTLCIEPASPWQNGYAESFHSRLRDEFLAVEEFESFAAARKLTAAWRDDYNHHRLHGSLGYQTPAEFAARCPASAPKAASATPQQPSPLQQGSGFLYRTRTFIAAGTGTRSWSQPRVPGRHLVGAA